MHVMPMNEIFSFLLFPISFSLPLLFPPLFQEVMREGGREDGRFRALFFGGVFLFKSFLRSRLVSRKCSQSHAQQLLSPSFFKYEKGGGKKNWIQRLPLSLSLSLLLRRWDGIVELCVWRNHGRISLHGQQRHCGSLFFSRVLPGFSDSRVASYSRRIQSSRQVGVGWAGVFFLVSEPSCWGYICARSCKEK